MDKNLTVTPGNWSVGKLESTIVSDTTPAGYPPHDGRTDDISIEYYGGFLIAESIRDGDAVFLAKTKELLLLAIFVAKDADQNLQSVKELNQFLSQFIKPTT